MFFSKNNDEGNKDKLQDTFIETACALGLDIPDESLIADGKIVAFGLTPQGVQGGDVLAGIIQHVFLNARMQGCPPELMMEFGCSLLGGFALAIGSTLAGAGEIDEQDEQEKMAALKEQGTSDRAELATALCERTAQHLVEFGEWESKQEEKLKEKKSALPTLVNAEAAAQLAKLFEMEG